jgi:non-specific serine/threonine protein kinase/serine/threonine-protein kinase
VTGASGSALDTLDPARAARVDAWLDEALDLDAAERSALLARARAEDPVAAAALERLIAALGAPNSLDRPALARIDGGTAEAADRSLRPGMRIGAWRIEGLAGRGGMASVHRAARADGAYAQRAAVKVVDSADPDLVARFEAERALLAALDHPHIARLLDGGTLPDGRLWFAMAWVDGLDLDAHLATARPTLDARLALFRQIAGAVAHAHRQLVVHRDLKPRNVRVTPEGRAILLDFGIARLVGADAADARTRPLMTPEYAAPEQLTGGPIGTWTDLHGLGLVLYEMLAGRHPFPEARDSLAAAVQAIVGREAEPPSVAARGADLPYPARALAGDLDAIVARCLAKDAPRRYPSVDALLDDLERHRRLLPVAARAGARRYRVGRWLRRNWLPASLGAGVIASLASGLVGFAIQAERLAAERDAARLEVRRQEALREHLMLAFREGAAQGGGATAKELLDASAAQLDELYGDDPDLRRQVLLAMGELYFTLGDYPAARAMVERFLAASGAGTPVDDRVLGHVQHAQVLLRVGEREAARAAIEEAGALRGATPERPRDLDAQLLAARSQLARADGEIERGLELQRAAVEATRRAVDRSPHRVGIAESNLGMAELQANRLDDARRTFERALATFEAAGYGRSVHAITTLGNLANAENLLGRLAEADGHYRLAIAQASVAMAESAAMAALEQNHARLLLTRNELDEAAERVARARAIAERFIGPDSLDMGGIRLTAAEIALAAGRLDLARGEITAAQSIYGARLPASHPLHARVALIAARIGWTADPTSPLDAKRNAIATLESAPPLLARQAVRGAVWLAEAALARGDRATAAAALERAIALPVHAELGDWERAEVRSWAALAGAESDREASLEADLAVLVEALGAGHPRVTAIAAARVRGGVR